MIAESLNIYKTIVLRILKEDLGKRKLCAHFVPHFLRPEQGKKESHLAKTLSRWPMLTKIFFNKNLREMRHGVLLMTPKQSEKSLNGTSPWLKKKTEIPKVPHQDDIDNFSRPLRRSAQRIHTRRKNSKYGIL
jgi:hypothetical protein